MAEERKVQLGFAVDADGVKQGLNEIKQDVRDMARDVEQSGQRAGQGLGKIGDGAPEASRKVDGASRSIIGSIERATAAMQAGAKGSAEYYEALAKQRGVSADAIKPYIDQLKAAERAQKAATSGLGSMEMSAKQTAAALRGVPAQFTDIITSLQGGQQPMTVFLQQGGQLKDMFGGAGAAARALGGYVLGLVNPFTVAAAGVATLGYAYAQGSKEADAYRMAMVTTGNAAGTTSGQLKSYAQEIAATIGTQGKAAESLAQLASSGKVANEVLREAAQASIAYERATGQAMGKTAESFASLAGEPLKAVLKLNDSMNFLTESTYRQIKSLEEQGRTADAAAVAQRSYADALTSRAGEIERNLGSIERGWLNVKNMAKSAWDAMLNVGRADTNEDKLASINKQIAELEKRRAGGFGETEGGAATGRPSAGAQARVQAELAALGAQKAAIEGVIHAERERGKQEAENAANRKLYYDWDQKGASFATKAQQRDAEIMRARAEGQQLVNAGLITQAQLEERVASIRKKYEEKTPKGSGAAGVGQSEVAAIRARIIETERYIAALQSQGAEAEKMTEGEKLVLKIQEELKTSISGVARAQKEKALAAAQDLAASQKRLQQEQELVKANAAAEAEYRKGLAAMADKTDAIDKQARELEAANAAFGKSKIAIEEYTTAQKQEQLAKLQGLGLQGEFTQELEREIEARQRLVAAMKEAEFKAAGAKYDEAIAAAQAQNDLVREEISLIGLTEVERKKIIAAREAEIELAKELREIDKLGLGDAQAEELRIKARAKSRLKAETAQAKATLDEWQKTADDINRALTDSLMRGFESGKGFAENLRDTLKNMFNTLVLRPIISAVMQPVSMLINGAVQGGLSMLGMGGGNGLMGMAGNASSLYSLASGGGALGNIASTVGGWLGLGSAATGLGLSAATGAGIIGSGIGAGLGLGSTAAAAGTGLGLSLGGTGLGISAGSAGASAIGAGLGTSVAAGGTGAAASGGIMGALGAIPGWGWALAGIAALAGLASSFKGETRTGGQFVVARDGEVYNQRRDQTYTYVGQQYDRDFSGGARNPFADGQAYRTEGDPVDGAQEAAIKKAVAGTADAITNILKTLGSEAVVTGFWAGLETSGKGRGGVYAGGSLSTGAAFGETGQGDNYAGTLYEKFSTNSPDFKAALENFTLDLKQATLQALQQVTDLPKGVQAMLKDLDVESLDLSAVDELLTKVADYPNQLLQSFGSSRDDLVKTFAEGLATGDAMAAGQMVADQFVAGVEASMLGNAASQIFDIVNTGIMMPILDAIATGSSVSEALAGANIEKTIAKAQETAAAFAAIWNDESFKSAMEQIRTTVGSALGSAGSALQYQPRYIQQPARELTQAADAAANAAEDARKKWEELWKSLRSDRDSAEIDLLRAMGQEEAALARERARAIEGMDAEQAAYWDGTRAILRQVAELEKLNALRDEQTQLEIELLQARGDEQGALALITKGMSDAERAAYLYNAQLRRQVDAVQALASELPALIERFLTPQQRQTAGYDRIAADLGRAGIPGLTGAAFAGASIDQIVAAAAAIYNLGDTSDETRLALVRAVSGLADMKTEAAAVAEAARQAAAQQRAGLETRLLQLQGNTVELRNREVAALEPANRALQRQIYALEDLAAAQGRLDAASNAIASEYLSAQSALESAQQGVAEATRQAAQEMLNFGNSIVEFLNRLQTTDMGNTSPESRYQAAAAQFRSTAALAQSGDRDALARITSVATDYLGASKDYYASGSGFSMDEGAVKSALQQILGVTGSGTAASAGVDSMTRAQEELVKAMERMTEIQEIVRITGVTTSAATTDLLAAFMSAQADVAKATADEAIWRAADKAAWETRDTLQQAMTDASLITSAQTQDSGVTLDYINTSTATIQAAAQTQTTILTAMATSSAATRESSEKTAQTTEAVLHTLNEVLAENRNMAGQLAALRQKVAEMESNQRLAASAPAKV